MDRMDHIYIVDLQVANVNLISHCFDIKVLSTKFITNNSAVSTPNIVFKYSDEWKYEAIYFMVFNIF